MKHLILLVLFIIATGCSVVGPAYQNIDAPEDGSALLFIYRPNVFQNGVISPGIMINDEELFLLGEPKGDILSAAGQTG